MSILKTMKMIKIALPLLAFACISTAFAEGKTFKASDLKDAEKNYKMICLQCHAKDGMGKARVNKKTGKLFINAMAGPRLAGLDESYLLKQLTEIHEGVRKNRNTISMKQKISKLTPVEMAALSHYISKQLNPEAGNGKGMFE